MRRAVLCGMLFCALACQRSAPRQSLVIAILDTTRADAVSAYGRVAGTTPTLDAIAREGVLYENAYANANWTVPSHASLFTGLFPSHHGLISGNEKLGATTLAERLQQLGYETVAMSENPWLATQNGIHRGFDSFALSNGDLVGMVRQWVGQRTSDRPYFLFLNVMDAHVPYEVRSDNPFLPPGTDFATARAVPQMPAEYVCDTAARSADLQIMRGLYLGDVQAADAKLAGLLQALEPLRRKAEPILIIASDHGEYLGEHARVGHVIGVNDIVLHVPLVVHGLHGVAPARIRAPVQLVDIVPSVLSWIGAQVPSGLAGQPLPTVEAATERTTPIVSEYGDYFRLNQQMPSFLRALKENMDARCAPDQRMFGDMRSIIQYPRKTIWYSAYAPQMFDLVSDPAEEHDLATEQPAVAAEMRAALDQAVALDGGSSHELGGTLSPDVLERLRGLGYFDNAPR